ncbi:MAG: tripartite tricarboxylate transporter substrate binding protein [Pseudomonadota bacterium]|uniref:Bug family tripartite tricarboxylate transporter substrate binding protein n=1 Tax=Aquabacter cavernae TaxID=2496029 RepID=UPI000F8DA825|nr:tripartite tricarboxylate transporter substrate binding protein [Aquabacter cavernae]MBA4790222.1 tripartite tricarboxylate transporter substrate binding protein [Hyphomicrobiales bacterium]
MMKKTLLTAVTAGAMALGLLAPSAQAAGYPDKAVKIIVPFAPGGLTDILARIIAQRLQERSGQPFVVDNRPGAGGNTGMEAVARSAPDGYTLGMIITSHAINMTMPPKPNYDVVKDLTPISILTLSNNVLVVNNKLPVNSVKELIAYGKEKDRNLTFASSGNGTTPHLSGELFKQMTGVNMTHIPYRGAGPAMVDVIGGNVPIMFDAISTAEPHIRSGAVRALAVTGIERSPLLPNVPTMEEAGLKGYRIDGWLGLVAPAGTPTAALQWLSAQTTEIMSDPEVQKKLIDQGMIVANYTGQAASDFIANEVKKWNSIVVNSGASQ